MLGIFNLCRSICPSLDVMVEPLQLPLNANKLLNNSELPKWVQNMWSYILADNLRLSLKQPASYLLQVDSSSSRYGYLIYVGAGTRAGGLSGTELERSRGDA